MPLRGGEASAFLVRDRISLLNETGGEKLMRLENNIEKLIVHHSWSPDNRQVYDWESIRKYHTSWRYNGEIIMEGKAKKFLKNGVLGVDRPWYDIGYHAGQEWYEGKFYFCQGRPESMPGDHCLEQRMNYRSLGYCFIGCFDQEPPTDEELHFASWWFATKIRKYHLKAVDCIEPHRKYAHYKSCPGNKFPLDKLKWFVAQRLLELDT
jgi:hypothetical protein